MNVAGPLDPPKLLLELLTGDTDALGHELRWVYATDLLEPEPFLTGGELVLTSEGWYREPADCALFAASLAAGGAVAVIAGDLLLGEVPPALVESALGPRSGGPYRRRRRQRGLTVLASLGDTVGDDLKLAEVLRERFTALAGAAQGPRISFGLSSTVATPDGIPRPGRGAARRTPGRTRIQTALRGHRPRPRLAPPPARRSAGRDQTGLPRTASRALEEYDRTHGAEFLRTHTTAPGAPQPPDSTSTSAPCTTASAASDSSPAATSPAPATASTCTSPAPSPAPPADGPSPHGQERCGGLLTQSSTTITTDRPPSAHSPPTSTDPLEPVIHVGSADLSGF
ncbi:PucR family transcriptional regulator ligand-binding domain-containing protein [Streptomyces sp. NBC_01197]|uniref:PucR family transcriptional regulator ligand-binding domain-containing protein n=1 Tax=Streptomyces sp. NBC_01197 TaxID=2903768 RepID=UPI003FA39193